ncbi:MAG: DUF952 domain-containing protein [Alphaproteobacteria bacterium]|nr:DUF952 domain-containing protein [Alphaproteobacteria bacterium]
MGEQPDLGAAERPGRAESAGLIYHIARADDWARAEAASRYAGSALCRADGFIHFSSPHQVAGTLGRFFAGADGLVLLAAEAAALGDGLKWERAPDGAIYPHYYGVLAVGRLRMLGPITRDGAGGHVIPVALGDAADPAGEGP